MLGAMLSNAKFNAKQWLAMLSDATKFLNTIQFSKKVKLPVVLRAMMLRNAEQC